MSTMAAALTVALRESVRSEKESLEKTVDELKAELAGSRDKTRMQLEQINGWVPR